MTSYLKKGEKNMGSIKELGGFTKTKEDINGTEEEFLAFNYCLAEDYVNAMYQEDFEELGEISEELLKMICKWYNEIEIPTNQNTVHEIKTGEFRTIQKRILIDAIYENQSASLAETYLLMEVYSPKLVLTILLSEEEDYQDYSLVKNQKELNRKMKELYDLIETEYQKCDNKKQFLNKIQKNYTRIVSRKEYTTKLPPIPNTYHWVKQLQKAK